MKGNHSHFTNRQSLLKATVLDQEKTKAVLSFTIAATMNAREIVRSSLVADDAMSTVIFKV